MAKSLQSSWFVSTEPFANTDAQQFLNSAKSSVVVCLLDMSLLISSLPIIPVALLCFILIERLWNVVQSFVCLSSQHFNWWRQSGEDCGWVKILELETNFEWVSISPWIESLAKSHSLRAISIVWGITWRSDSEIVAISAAWNLLGDVNNLFTEIVVF